MAGPLKPTALIELAQLLEARALELDGPGRALRSWPGLAPPPDPWPILEPVLQRLSAAIAAARSRLSSCQQQVRVLSEAPPELSAALFSVGNKSSLAAQQELESEGSALTLHIQTLQAHHELLQARLERAMTERLEAAARHAAIRPELRLGLHLADAPLGPRIADTLEAAVLQAHDLVLAQEQRQPEPAARYWDWKDRLDLALDQLPLVRTEPTSQGWPKLLEVVREVEQVCVELSEP